MEIGLLEAELVGIPTGGWRREFAAGQLERARLIKALHRKGATLSQLARSDLTDLAAQAYVILDGHVLRACPDAAASIAVVVRAKRWCSAVDLTAIRAGTATGYNEPHARQR
jgi:hypothetical protein